MADDNVEATRVCFLQQDLIYLSENLINSRLHSGIKSFYVNTNGQ